MKNCKTACFVFCAREACKFSVIKDLNAEAMRLAATIKKNFEELGV
ncbi:hypothetical protein SAMN05660653_00486 [Desulfonatronum thiosulfatophilum]|uniref:Uncharacterized protein n=1 Tax=Desulfonatronum thiosulfatophilum TaxID=617002 RepID=A0A1G6AM78_9BACT|nr:hypothetical protein SAMN05660653_00486 [Desulfonatronum thiosulfatophilum]